MSRCSKIHTGFTSVGSYFEIQIWHDGLGKTEIIKSGSWNDLKSKANLRMKQWDEKWKEKIEREQLVLKRKEQAEILEQKKNLASQRSVEARELLGSLERILDHTLSIDKTINWDILISPKKFKLPKPNVPQKPKQPTYQEIPHKPQKVYTVDISQKDIPIVPIQPLFLNLPSKPKKPIYKDLKNLPSEPNPNDAKYKPKFGAILFNKKNQAQAHKKFQKDKESWRLRVEKRIEHYNEINRQLKLNYERKLEDYKRDLKKLQEHEDHLWEAEKEKIIENNKQMQITYELQLKKYNISLREVETWKKIKKDFLLEQEIMTEAMQFRKENYFKCDQNAIVEYCKLVLSNSEYHENFPKEFELKYTPENKIIIVNYQLPPINSIPTLNDVKYIQNRDEFAEKHITKTELIKLYDNILYQITLRTIHELYQADQVNALESIIFNGYVSSINPATGHEINACILSIQANREEFEQINLPMIEPKACFKTLKGVGSSKLYNLTPIPPLVKINREDSRFIESYSVVDGIDEGFNLAAMDWEDFENLIREVFEQAYADTGGEVKITQASRDGGVDAVIFDPDPLRGGKTIVQAKRYTNVVGVSAVRDLYGTLMNEGANKGILVTTSDYGPDAYKFATNKPLQLINGNNLLHLLEKYGHKARIDLNEAKKILKEEEKLFK